ncbi:hypothetical protein ACFVVC_01700 [Pseudarthrobacter sp. NPDC058196]|uniref:hypothetical protein n=1 Tax=Pseudarthrobacter sp. NPDC058196 TaxID=3346376 RepID=UPI0036DC7164
MTVKDKDKYTFTLAFDLTVSSSPLGEDTASAKPGQANVSWSSTAAGTMTLTNTTAGHTLVMPDEFTSLCQIKLAETGCPILYGFYPATSPICTVKMADQTGSSYTPGFNVTNPFYHPVGSWCAVAFALAPYSNVPPYNQTVLPIGGASTTQWVPYSYRGDGVSGTLYNEADFPALAATTAAPPAQWAIEAGNSLRQEMTPSTPVAPPECQSSSYVIYATTAMTCH